jgi:O-antigen/teichoic acid export membrane protein
MQKKQIIKNVMLSIIQFLLVGIVLFILYKFLLNKIGAELFGVWSLVLSTTTFANIANLGFSGSVVKYVAQSLAKNNVEKVVDIIETSVISIGVSVGLVLLISFPLAKGLLRMIIPSSHLSEAMNILPYAMLSLWISVIAGIFQAGKRSPAYRHK